MLGARRYSSAPFAAPDHEVNVPPPAFAREDFPKRHSSYNLPVLSEDTPAFNMSASWSHERPSTSYSTRSAAPFQSLNGRVATTPLPERAATATPRPNRLQPSASAIQLARAAPQKADTKRKSRLFGKTKATAPVLKSPPAWMLFPSQDHRTPFDVDAMMAGQPVRDLWDESGNCYIHLYPRAQSKGPSFRLPSALFGDSATLTMQAFGHLWSTESTANSRVPSRTMSSNSSESATSPRSSEDHQTETHLFLDVILTGRPAPPLQRDPSETPISDDQQTMVDIRNLFGFLCGAHLVASQRRFTMFSIFMRIAELLQIHDFSNVDASTFGEVAMASFDNYTIELNLADVRRTTAKAVEMLVLSEKMRSVRLYNEAFTHVVGKHDECQQVAPNTYRMISETTRTRLSRAAMDLEKRVTNVNNSCADFHMPSIFAGMMNSRTFDERHHVDFDLWKSSFLGTRRFMLRYYKSRFGSWPPKPNPKRNNLRTPGLNRVVLMELYSDLCTVYDMLVDRTDLTNRTADGVLIEELANDPPIVRAIRHILSEWDRHSPPVKPPMPFDLPLLPCLQSCRPEFGKNAVSDAKLIGKKVKSDDVLKVLHAAHNPVKKNTPFLQAFRDFERAQAKNRNIKEIVDLRCGQWIFLYAVLQALPILVIDAPALMYTEGVEYFLCQASRGGAPWSRDVTSPALQWYGIAGGQGPMVALPSDVIENSIDAIYRRSHCWKMAAQWSADDPLMAAAVQEQQQANSSLPPPPEVLADSGSIRRRLPRIDSRSSSPARSHYSSKRESILGLGLEVLPVSRGVSPVPSIDRRLMSASSEHSASSFYSDPSKTFDSILAGVGTQRGRK